MADDDLGLKNYQDDLDTDPNKIDTVTHEQTDDLAEDAGIPRHELARELKKLQTDDLGRGDDDARETVEDLDQDMPEGGKS